MSSDHESIANELQNEFQNQIKEMNSSEAIKDVEIIPFAAGAHSKGPNEIRGTSREVIPNIQQICRRQKDISLLILSR